MIDFTMANIPQPKKKRFYKKWWFWALLVVGMLIIISIAGAAMQSQTAKSTEYQNLQEKVVVEKRDLERTVAANGTLEADEQTSLSFSAGGSVTDVFFNVGDEVTKNQVIAQTGLEKLKSPFDGRVLALNVFEGQTVGFGEVAAVIGYRSSHVEFFASETEVLELEIGQMATVSFPAYNNGRDEYIGSVNFVDVQKASSQTALQSSETGYVVKIHVDDLPSEVEAHLGLTADVEVVVGSANDALSLETGSIQYEENGEPYVYLVPIIDDAFVLRAKGVDDITTVLEKKSITTGFEADDYIEITSGLNEGDEVLLYIPPQASTSFF